MASTRRSDVRVIRAETFKVRSIARTPLKFGGVVVDDLPLGYARVTVENRAGQIATGWGAMFLMDLWAWPVSQASHAVKNQFMCDLFDAYAQILEENGGYAHPIDHFMGTQPELDRLRREWSAVRTPGEEMPHLGALICASPLDHALHDAYGHVNGIDSYCGYGPEFMGHDLAPYHGRAFANVYPNQFLRQAYTPSLPIFHLVGGLDALRKSEPDGVLPEDGLPNSLDEWIAVDGVYCLKIKLRGQDLAWDLARTVDVSRVYHEVRGQTRPDLPDRPYLTADTNEMCESPEYVMEYLRLLRDRAPEVYEELLYLEQPTERDLTAKRWDMRAVGRLKPVLIDESLATIEDFHLARELGWSGIALKSCKCLSTDLLLVPLAEMAGVPYAIQDLTNPSLALVESSGLAARTNPILGLETNSRQFFPGANELIANVHPGLCQVRSGRISTRSLRGTGLGMQVDEIVGFAAAIEQANAEFRPLGE